jgi:hypothetical protein
MGATRNTPWDVWFANTCWPGWENGRWGDDVPAPPPIDASRLTRLLEATLADLRNSLYKRPPVKALTAADRISFVGATNDQLGPAVASAFCLREHRLWDRLELFFLDDEPLATLRSDGRTGAALLRDRDPAQAALRRLLPRVARSWVIWRSPVRYPDDTFASVWDLENAATAWVHASRFDGNDIRTSAGTDFIAPMDPALIADWRARLEAIRAQCRRVASAGDT